jgi:hypothetical protein
MMDFQLIHLDKKDILRSLSLYFNYFYLVIISLKIDKKTSSQNNITESSKTFYNNKTILRSKAEC